MTAPLLNPLYRPPTHNVGGSGRVPSLRAVDILRPCCELQGLEIWQPVYMRDNLLLHHRYVYCCSLFLEGWVGDWRWESAVSGPQLLRSTRKVYIVFAVLVLTPPPVIGRCLMCFSVVSACRCRARRSREQQLSVEQGLRLQVCAVRLLACPACACAHHVM